jgi:hypothetical protein
MARTREARVVGEASICFHCLYSTIEKRAMSIIQEVVLKKKKSISNEDILLEAKEWVTNPRQSRTKEKNTSLAETYWHKAMVA